MSDWIDLQLAHSLGRAKAPDELWDRLQGRAPRRRRPIAVRWAVPMAIAACVTVMLARPVQEGRFELVANQRADIAHRLAHEAAAQANGSAVIPIAVRSELACGTCHSL